MATISSPGLGSGLDVNSIVSQLMTIERQPITNLDTKEAKLQAQISALGSLKGAVSSLQSAATALTPATGQTAAAKFSTYTASLADTTVASASAGSGAVAGSYSLEVTALAREQKLVSGTYASSSAVVGSGTLTIDIGSVSGGVFTAKSGTTPVTLTIGSGNNTLAGIRDAINAANAGVTATIVNGTAGSQLILTGATGTANLVRLSGTPAGLAYDPATNTGGMTQTQSAQDAAFKINGIAATSGSNTVSGALDGVTLTLAKTNTGNPTTLNVTRDVSASITSGINTFVQAYNSLVKTMKSLGSYDAATKTAGLLLGDSAMRSVQGKLTSLLYTTPAGVTGSVKTLSDIGVSAQADGSLSLDSAKLQNAISSNSNDVASLVAGYGSAYKSMTDGLIGSNGIISAETVGINATITDIGKQRDALNLRMTGIEARYRAQFTALDTLISSMNKTSSFLTQQLANLPGVTSSSKG